MKGTQLVSTWASGLRLGQLGPHLVLNHRPHHHSARPHGTFPCPPLPLAHQGEEQIRAAGAQSPLFPQQPPQDPPALPGLDRKWWQLSSRATLEPALSLGRPGCSDASGPNCPQLLQHGPCAPAGGAEGPWAGAPQQGRGHLAPAVPGASPSLSPLPCCVGPQL